MRVIPVDPARTAVVFIESVPKCDQDGIQRRHRDTDQPLWALRCMVRVLGDPSKPEIVDIVVPSNRDLGEVLDALIPVTFTDLGVMAWAIDGKNGLAFSASSVKPASDVKVRPSTNGAKVPEAAA